MTARAITSRRWFYWASFSVPSSIAGTLLTFAAMAVVAAGGVASGQLISGAPTGFPRDLLAASVATAALRRVRGSERGATLALGLVPEIREWIDTHIAHQVEQWASRLDDHDLVAAAAVLDERVRGLSKSSSFEQRATWRKEQSKLLASPDQDVREQARQDLEALIATGYPQYQQRRRA